MSFRYCWITLFSVLTISSAANAASTAMFQFLRTPSSTRLAALGGVSTAYPSDSTVFFTNSSAGSYLLHRDINLGGVSYLNGVMNSINASAVLHFERKKSAIGFTTVYNYSNHQRINAPLLPNEYNFMESGTFMAYNFLLGGHFATMTAARTSFGFSLKLVNEKLLNQGYMGIISDISLSEIIDKTSLFSIGVKNVGIVFGQAYTTPVSGFLSICKKVDSVNLILEGEYAISGNGELKIGIEIPVISGFELRTGFMHPLKDRDTGDFVLSRLTAGVGISTKNFRIDYACTFKGDLGVNHLFSIGTKL